MEIQPRKGIMRREWNERAMDGAYNYKNKNRNQGTCKNKVIIAYNNTTTSGKRTTLTTSRQLELITLQRLRPTLKNLHKTITHRRDRTFDSDDHNRFDEAAVDVSDP